jgi:DNA-binding NtrC family response regulator
MPQGKLLLGTGSIVWHADQPSNPANFGARVEKKMAFSPLCIGMMNDEVKDRTIPRILWIEPGTAAGDDQAGCTIAHEQTLEAGLLRLQNARFDCVMAHLAAGADCENLIEMLQREAGATPVFVRLAENSVTTAALLARSGASRVYGSEASSGQILCDTQIAAFDHHQRFISSGQEPWRRTMIGRSDTMRRVGDLVARIAARKSTILITGESGTGKEVVATALHAASGRAKRPFLAVNCGALPEGLLESELFGHKVGAFTGAVQNRVGLFEHADRGTVFLDEIGDMPLSLQAKLLRVLQEQQFQRLGSSEPVRIDVRIIAATNANLERAIAEGRFREDLYYRLNVVPIHLPPLRERIEDIPELASHLIEKICRAEGLRLKTLTSPALTRLSRCSWPGNVRQLQNVIERAVVAGNSDVFIYPSDIQIPSTALSSTPQALDAIDTEHGLDFDKTVAAFEKRILEQVIRQTAGNKTRAAELLRLRRTTLSAKLRVLTSVA